MPKVIQIIEHSERRGEGTKEDVVRMVYQLFTLDGKLIMEHDPNMLKTPEIIELTSSDPKEIAKIKKNLKKQNG